MKLIYVAGRYRAKTASEMLDNIRRAEAVAKSVWRIGHAAICPHLNSAFFDGVAPDEHFLAGTMMMLAKCDGVVLVEGWESSEGAVAEVFYAKENEIPVFTDVEELFDAVWEEEPWYCDLHGEVERVHNTDGLPVCPHCGMEVTPF